MLLGGIGGIIIGYTYYKIESEKVKEYMTNGLILSSFMGLIRYGHYLYKKLKH